MIVFALDPGARSGWAVSDPGYSHSGAVDHEAAAMEAWWDDRAPRGMKAGWAKFAKEERLKRVLGTFQLWLEAALRYAKPAVLVVERQKPFAGRANTHVLEFRGATFSAAGRLDLALVECPPEKWRALLCGRAYDPARDHALAAELMLAWYEAQPLSVVYCERAPGKPLAQASLL